MADTPQLTETQISDYLSSLPGWRYSANALVREFVFSDFKQAFEFMAAIAHVADAMNHHPEWTNVYNKLTVKLSTHDAGGVTDKDFELARQMNARAKPV